MAVSRGLEESKLVQERYLSASSDGPYTMLSRKLTPSVFSLMFMDRENSFINRSVASMKSESHPSRMPPLVPLAGRNWNPSMACPRVWRTTYRLITSIFVSCKQTNLGLCVSTMS
jgi:hypothetical protein